MAASWNKSPTYDTSKDIEFFSDVEDATDTINVPFAVIEVYTEACGGGGGGGKASASPRSFPDDAASGGGGGAWCYKTWDVVKGDEFTFNVGKGGLGKTGPVGRGEDGGDSIISYTTGLNNIPMTAGGGVGGARSDAAPGGTYTGADGGVNGQSTDRIVSNNKDARGGRGGGAAGLGRGSRVNGNFTINFECCSDWLRDGEDWTTCASYNSYSVDVEARICGGPGGHGTGVGGTLLNLGADADTTPEGYYRVNGKPGGLYGGGGGGSSGGHGKTYYTLADGQDYYDLEAAVAASGVQIISEDPLWLGCDSYYYELTNTKNRGDGGDGARGFVYLAANYKEPEIVNVEIPTVYNIQGFPSKNMTCNYQTKYASEIWLVDSRGREMFRSKKQDANGEPDKVPDGGSNFTSFLQSNVENGLSPACDTFTFYAKGPGGQVSQTVEGCIYNDDCIKDVVIPDQGPFDPNESVSINVKIKDIDMPTRIQVSSGLTFDIDFQGLNIGTSSLVNNNETVTLKTKTLPFCTDERGLQHYRNLYVEFGSGEGDCSVKRYDFTVITRAPVIAEQDIDFTDNNISFPYPKIDTTDAVPTKYLSNNNGPVPIQDIELADPYGVQVRVLDTEFSTSYTKNFEDIRAQKSSNAQVRVNRSEAGLRAWKNPNIIGVNELPPADGPCVTDES